MFVATTEEEVAIVLSMAKITRLTEDLDEEFLSRLVNQYLEQKKFAEQISKRVEELKQQLARTVDAFGNEDDKGNRWLSAGNVNLKRERRVSRPLNVQAAEQWARENNLWDSVTVVVEQVSEDKLMKLAWESSEYADAIASLYDEKVVWAFKTTEERVPSHADSE